MLCRRVRCDPFNAFLRKLRGFDIPAGQLQTIGAFASRWRPASCDGQRSTRSAIRHLRIRAVQYTRSHDAAIAYTLRAPCQVSRSDEIDGSWKAPWASPPSWLDRASKRQAAAIAAGTERIQRYLDLLELAGIGSDGSNAGDAISIIGEPPDSQPARRSVAAVTCSDRFNAHSQTVATRQSCSMRSRCTSRSRRVFASNLACQNSGRVEGDVAYRHPSCLCQKQP